MKHPDIRKSGKCGNTVWQSNRYAQYCYPAFIPFNPRTPAQVAVRETFRAVSARWRTLAQEQRDIWSAVGRTKWSKPRLGRGRLTGFNYFVKINVPLANRGLAQVDLPPRQPSVRQRAASSLFHTNRCHQLPVGPTLFLQANHLMGGWDSARRKLAAGVSPPT